MVSKVAVIGECMLELKHEFNPEQYSESSMPIELSYGGDTLNLAVYMSRLGASVEYISAVGSDSLSEWMVHKWDKEGVGCQYVERFEGESSGIYLIELDDKGERSFRYWREQAPVRKIFSTSQRAEKMRDILSGFDHIFLSGITLGILDDESRARLFKVLSDYREKGGKVIFDGNYREKLWRDKDEAKSVYMAMYELTDITLPTIDDELELFGETHASEVLERIRSTGVREIVLKMGGDGCLVADLDSSQLVPGEVVTVVDSTSAGDSFNAAYIATRLQGKSTEASAKAGHKLASTVIQYRGAVIPKENMPKF